jgi:hypothetical protein
MMIKRASAAMAVSAFGLALGAGASFADTHEVVQCGTPAVPAVYGWVVTQPAVEEVSHLEYRWALQTAAERTEYFWQRVTTTTTYRWRLWVPNSQTPAVQWSATSPGEGWEQTGNERVVVDTPAVTESVTYYEFDNVRNDKLENRWEPDPNWNSNNNSSSNGWVATGRTEVRTEVITPAVTHTEFEWREVLPDGEYIYQESVTNPDPGAGWEAGEVVDTSTTTEEVWSESEPEGGNWRKTDQSRTVPATFDYRWAAESPGAGWERTDVEPRKVVDVPAVAEVKEWQVVVPAVPAGEPCPVDEEPVDEDPVDEEPVDEEPVDEDPVDPVVPVHEPADPAEAPVTPVAPPVTTPRSASAVPQVTAAQTASPTSLAYTGSDLTLLWTGVGLVVVGAGLSAGCRRVLRES